MLVSVLMMDPRMVMKEDGARDIIVDEGSTRWQAPARHTDPDSGHDLIRSSTVYLLPSCGWLHMPALDAAA